MYSTLNALSFSVRMKEICNFKHIMEHVSDESIWNRLKTWRLHPAVKVMHIPTEIHILSRE